MEKEFIELFKGYEGDFGIADMSNPSIDSDKIKLNQIMNGQVARLQTRII